MSHLTLMLHAVEQGDPGAADRLLPLVYDELRQLAARRMSREPNQTLQPTALVHEAWLKLVGQDKQAWKNRGHFYATAAEAMRRILIDKARRRRSSLHGGGLHRVDVQEVDIESPSPDDELIAISEALDRLAAHDREKAELVKLRYFTGLTIEEAAALMNTSPATAKRHWAFARAWLKRELRANGTITTSATLAE